MINVYKVLIGKPEKKSPLGKRTRRREDNIRMDHEEIGWEVVYWMNLAQKRDQ
jgi:hypothetical protein